MESHKARLLELLKAIGQNSSRGRVFNDFLTITASTIANQFGRDTMRRQLREERFLSAISGYCREDVYRFVEMLPELILALEDCIGQKCLRVNAPALDEIGFNVMLPFKGSRPKFGDVLGDIFKELKLFEQDNGQVFTPEFVADIMAELATDENFVADEINRNGFVVIRESCCGSGAIVLEGLNKLIRLGINPQKSCLVIASDLDERCVHMTYIQLSLYGIPAVVTQRNDITDEEISPPWYTPMFIRDGWSAHIEAIRKSDSWKMTRETKVEQLTLF